MFWWTKSENYAAAPSFPDIAILEDLQITPLVFPAGRSSTWHPVGSTENEFGNANTVL